MFEWEKEIDYEETVQLIVLCIGIEVSHDSKYYNSELSVTPFSQW